MKKLVLLLVLVTLSLVAAGCGSQEQVATVTIAASPSPPPTATPTEEPTPIPIATPTEEPTPRPTPWIPTAPTEPCEPSETQSCSIVFVFPRRSYTHWASRMPRKFEEAGYDVIMASKAESVITPCGGGGRDIEVDIALADVKVEDYDAIIVVGGNGCRSQWDDDETHRIAQDAVAHGKVLGAAGCAPTILAHAGVLDGLESAICTADAAVKRGLDYCEVLESLGVNCGRGIVREELIVTAQARSLYFVPAVLETIEMVAQ